MSKRQRGCFTIAFCRCGDLSGKFIRFEPERAVLADNVLNRTHLEDCAFQISIAIHRCMHRIPEGVLMLIETGQHRALLLYLNPPLDRRIGDRDFLNLCRFSHGHDRETDDQEKQRHQDDRSFILCEIHPLYLISQSMKRERAADLAAALRLTSQDLPFLPPGYHPSLLPQESGPSQNSRHPDNHPVHGFQQSGIRPRSAAAFPLYRPRRR